jgi:hypothetical protein
VGFLKKLIGGAGGTREAIRESYAKHRRIAENRDDLDDSPHATGLYGALASRYRVSARIVPEPQIWPELLPFLMMPETLAVEMLAEYVMFQEQPQVANVKLLSEAINFAVESGLNEDQNLLAIAAFVRRAPWCLLLKSDLREELQSAAVEIQSREQP